MKTKYSRIVRNMSLTYMRIKSFFLLHVFTLVFISFIPIHANANQLERSLPQIFLLLFEESFSIDGYGIGCVKLRESPSRGSYIDMNDSNYAAFPRVFDNGLCEGNFLILIGTVVYAPIGIDQADAICQANIEVPASMTPTLLNDLYFCNVGRGEIQ